MLTNSKELRKLLKEAERCGWVFTRRSKHIKGVHPSGKTTTIIALESGQWIGYPNNRLVWHDESWITPAPNKEWETPTHNYFVEGR